MDKCICNLKNGEETHLADGDWTLLKLKKLDDGFYIEGWGDGVASMRINYCPKCGRKLSDD